MNEPTRRERDILWKLAAGYTLPMIAETLGISPLTVKAHLDKLYLRIDVHTRSQAVAKALRSGWIE